MDLKWQKYHPLSDKNAFICLVDVMGDDSSIIQAARVSYGKDEPCSEEDLLDKYLLEGAKKHFGERATEVNVTNGNMTVFMEEQGDYPEILFEGPLQCGNAQAVIDYCHKKTSAQKDRDRQLIRYLMNHSHTTPFEMVEFKFMVQVPMDCWRQWIRHRTANVNEYSTRYTEAIDACQITPENEWRLQATDNKQGSSGYLDEWPGQWRVEETTDYLHDTVNHYGIFDGDNYIYHCPKDCTPGSFLTEREFKFHQEARKIYNERLALGVAKEQARKDLPLSTYTRAYWKCDLHNIFNFLRLRMDSHAQLEIRSFANCMFEIIKQICPVACEAFEDYVLHAKRFSRMEMEVLKDHLTNLDYGLESQAKPSALTDREWKDFLKKLEN